MVCAGHELLPPASGGQAACYDSSVFLADNDLYQKEIIPDWLSSLNKWPTMVGISDS